MCYGTLGQKIRTMCKLLDVKGIGPKRGEELAAYCKTSHFEACPKIFGAEARPEITLGMLFRLCFVEGIDTEWEQVCAPYGSVDMLRGDYKGRHKGKISEAYELARQGEEYFTILQPTFFEYEPLIIGRVMLTGPIPGLSHHDVFIHGMRQVSQGLISFDISKNARKTGVDYLITCDKASRSRKANVAHEEGIPIVTPDEFTAMMEEKLKKAIAEKGVTKRGGAARA
jgi:hypothetical protein